MSFTVTPNRSRVQRITICSIYPNKGKFEQSQEHGIRVFDHAPAPLDEILVRDFIAVPDVVKHPQYDGTNLYIDTRTPCAKGAGYSLYHIYDSVQWLRDWDAQPNIVYIDKPLQADRVAYDIVNAWAGNTLGVSSGFAPGVGIIAGDIPTEKEISDLRYAQTQFFQWLVDRGNDMSNGGRIAEISDLHRIAARWLGVEKQCKWVTRYEFVAMKKCPLCQEDMPAMGIKCNECKADIVSDFYLKYGVPPVEEQDPGAYQFMEKIGKLPSNPLPPPDKLQPKKQAA